VPKPQSNQEILEFLQNDQHKIHLIQTLQSLQYVKQKLTPAPARPHLSVSLPPLKRANQKTIIFDLDETLVHCIEDFRERQVDHIIRVDFPSGQQATAGINVRPYALECLRKASKLF